MLSEKTVERVSLYRRLLSKLMQQDTSHVFSHQLAEMAHATPVQVRRDLMLAGISGNPSRGYRVSDLITGFSLILDAPLTQFVALVGIGNLGRAILSYFPLRSPKLSIVAAFDSEPSKVGRLVHGCRTYPMEEFSDIAR
ncbi:redox-sensing transcriptional repressor Rex, partial [bacterium]|nr:redox-sensing transcriptional repressor Rex [candidate division CSSED10-310 bacterium]